MAFPVRGLDPDVLDRLDAAARKQGMSRNTYIVAVLTEHAQRFRPAVTPESFSHATDLAVDLGDGDLMRSAWS